MFSQDDLRELATVECDAPMLTLYLNVDPTERTTDEYKLALRQMLKQVDGQASQDDVAAVERYFEHEFDWTGRGVVVMSCAASGFWRTYALAVPVTSTVVVARKPYIWPLAALLDAYGSYAVALVDRQDMTVMLFEMGALKASERFEGEEVRKLKRGRGSSAGPGRRGGAPVSSRHEDELVQRNLREAAKLLERFWRKHEPQRLLIAGSEPTVVQFQDELPKALQERIVGSFSADTGASEIEVRDRTLAILKKVEEERKAALVDAVFTAAAKGQAGVIRLDDTLGAAHEGRIQTLVVGRRYQHPGYQCQNCAYITDQKLHTCPFCGGEVAEIPDAVEALVTQVIESGGRVEVVDNHPKIAEFGVGALLRY